MPELQVGATATQAGRHLGDIGGDLAGSKISNNDDEGLDFDVEDEGSVYGDVSDVEGNTTSTS